MISFSQTTGVLRQPFLARTLLLIALTIGAAAPPTQAATPEAVATCNRDGGSTIVLASLLDRFFSFASSALSSQQRMLQLGIIGMCIGLYILMRR
jgi:hypothetical protein